MYVTDIEITEIPQVTDIGAEMGATTSSVVFMSYERQIQVLSSIQDATQSNPVKRRLAFMRDALRQLNRMPEFRAGRAEIQFGPGLIPEGVL